MTYDLQLIFKKSVFYIASFLLLWGGYAQAQDTFQYELKKEGYYGLKRLEQVGDGRFLMAHLKGAPDSLLVIDVKNKKPLKLKGLYGAVQSFDLVPQQNLVLIHTGAESYQTTASQCFVYDAMTFELKKVITIGKAKKDTTKRDLSWFQPQDTGYESLLTVTGDDLYIINRRNDVMKYSMQSGEADSLFKITLPKDYFMNNYVSAFHKGIFTSMVYTQDKQGKILWHDSKANKQNFINLPKGYQLLDFKVYKDSIAWYLAGKKDEKGNDKSILIGLDIASGNEVFNKETPAYSSKMEVDQSTGSILTSHYGTARLWTRKANDSGYEENGTDLEIGDDIFYFAAGHNALLTADYSKFWIYNLNAMNEAFSVSVDLNGKDEESFIAIREWPGSKKVFYVLETDKTFKFGIMPVKYPSGTGIADLNGSAPPVTGVQTENALANRVNVSDNRPKLVLQDGHQARPTDIVFAKNKGWIISGDESGELIFWDLKSRMMVKKLQIARDDITRTGSIMHLALHPERDVIAVSWNYDAVVWVDFEGNELSRLKTDGQSNLVHFSEDGKYFFYERKNNQMSVVDIEKGSILTTYDFTKVRTINNYAFSGDSKRIALSDASGKVKILDALTGKVLEEVKTANNNEIRVVAYHPELDVLATLGSPMELCLTDLKSKKSNVVLTKGKDKAAETIWSLIFSKRGEIVLSGSLGTTADHGSDNNLLSAKYDPLSNYTKDWGLYYNTGDIEYIQGAVADDEGNTIWTVHGNNAIEVWNVGNKSHIKTLKGNKENIVDVLAAKNFNGLLVGTSGSPDYHLRKMDFGTAGFSIFDGIKFGTENFYFNTDGTYTTSFSGSVKQIDLKADSVLVNEESEIGSINVGNTAYGSVYYHEGVLSMVAGPDKTVKILHKFSTEEDNYYYWKKENEGKTYQFDTDGERLFLYDFKKFWCFDLQSGKKTVYPPDASLISVDAFEVYGNDLLIAAKNSLYLYHLPDGKLEVLPGLLKGKALFGDAVYPAVMGKSAGGRIALSFVADTLKINGKSIQQLEVFKPGGNTGVQISSLRDEPIKKLVFSEDEKQLFVVYKKQVDIIGLADQKLIATIATISGGKFILYTPDHYYFASPKFSDVGFRMGDKIYDITQFDLKFNRPDVVLERLGYAGKDLIEIYKKAYEKRLGRLGLTIDQLTIQEDVPQLALQNRDKLELITEKGEADLQLEITKGGKELANVHVTVNEVPVTGMQGIALNGGLQKTTITQLVKLTKGINRIRMYASDELGFESLKEQVEINYNPAEAPKSRLWYAGIGVSKYQDSTRNLTYADKDVRDLQGIFKDTYNAKTTILVNSEVTLEALRDLKKELMATDVEDVVVLSLSGHGLVNKEGDFYFAGHQTDFDKPEGTGVPFGMLEWLLDSIPARKKLLLIDACHSGELEKDVSVIAVEDAPLIAGVKEMQRGGKVRVTNASVGLQNSFELMKELFTDLSKSNGAEVISAAGGMEYAFENAKYSNGVFTYCLKKALLEKAADADGNKKVNVSELKAYMIREVSKLTGGRQRPTVRQETVGTDWMVW